MTTGWSIDQITALTPTQFNLLYDSIYQVKYSQLKFDANIHGRKLLGAFNRKYPINEKIILSKEDEDFLDRWPYVGKTRT